LLNMMAGTERAIVTEEAGTTRDTLDITVDCCGIPVILTDTAGLRDAEGKAEAIGIERAIKAVEAADLILAVREAGTAFEAELLERIDGRNVIFIANKTDIATEEPDGQTVYVSARTGEGAEELRRRIYERASVLPCEDVLITHQRQADCLRRAHTALCYAIDGADNGADADCISICNSVAASCKSQPSGEVRLRLREGSHGITGNFERSASGRADSRNASRCVCAHNNAFIYIQITVPREIIG
jgi:tRNA modification GTPase